MALRLVRFVCSVLYETLSAAAGMMFSLVTGTRTMPSEDLRPVADEVPQVVVVRAPVAVADPAPVVPCVFVRRCIRPSVATDHTAVCVRPTACVAVPRTASPPAVVRVRLAEPVQLAPVQLFVVHPPPVREAVPAPPAPLKRSTRARRPPLRYSDTPVRVRVVPASVLEVRTRIGRVSCHPDRLSY